MTAILGLLKPKKGLIFLDGVQADPNDHAWKKNVGFMFQNQGFHAKDTVEANLKVISRFYPTWDKDYSRSVLERVKLNPKSRVGELSTGERAKLSFVAAVSHRPSLLVLDEPTNGMDALASLEFLEILADTVRFGDQAALVSSHILADVASMSDYFAYIQDGKILHSFEKDELLDSWRRISFRSEKEISVLPSMESCERLGPNYVVTTSNVAATLAALEAMDIEAMDQHRLDLSEITRFLLKK